jgi:hypothetical protein
MNGNYSNSIEKNNKSSLLKVKARRNIMENGCTRITMVTAASRIKYTRHSKQTINL